MVYLGFGTYPCLAGNEGMEMKMESTKKGDEIGTSIRSIRIYSFLPLEPE